MQMGLLTSVLLFVVASTLLGQAPSSSSSRPPMFEVVSIKRSLPNQGPGGGSASIQRPDGGFTMTRIPVATLIARAYPPHIPADMVGLPGWARTERYDVSATSSLARATADDRIAMLRAMLAQRLNLVAHFEKHERPAFDLVLARRDGTLGPSICSLPAAIDCDAQVAAQRAIAEAETSQRSPKVADLDAPPPACTLRIVGSLLEGETTMANLASMLRSVSGRFVVDRTGLSGSFNVRMTFDPSASARGPATTPTDGGPSVFDALKDQLGLKLEPSRAAREVLVIDKLDRPTEN